MEDEDFGVGVVEQVGELVLEVAVVDVGRNRAHFEDRERRFDVLVAVVEIERDLRVGLDVECLQRAREPCRPVVELAPGDPPVTLDERELVGHRVGDGLPNRGDVPVQRTPPSFR